MMRPAWTLIDTSSWVEALRRNGDPVVRERVRRLMIEGRAAWCELVRLELWNGARGDAEKKHLGLLEREIQTLPIDREVWTTAFELAKRSRSAGRTYPATDCLIAACALRHGTPIEHCDSHLTEIQEAEFFGLPPSRPPQ